MGVAAKMHQDEKKNLLKMSYKTPSFHYLSKLNLPQVLMRGGLA